MCPINLIENFLASHDQVVAIHLDFDMADGWLVPQEIAAPPRVPDLQSTLEVGVDDEVAGLKNAGKATRDDSNDQPAILVLEGAVRLDVLCDGARHVGGGHIPDQSDDALRAAILLHLEPFQVVNGDVRIEPVLVLESDPKITRDPKESCTVR